MSKVGDAMDVAAVKEATDANQTRAADPAASAWVSANAGTGKTHVLVNRILRLLLAGNRPEGILCLTYTRAAAAEMQNRLFRELGAWATMSVDELDEALARLTGARPSVEEAALARRLFARTIETRGGLKIHTIHAFCERLLHRFPLEAGISADFTVLDERGASALKQQAVDKVLSQAAEDVGGALGDALQQIVARSAEQSFREIVEVALAEDIAGAGDRMMTALERDLAVDASDSTDRILEDQAAVIDDETMRLAVEALAQGSITDRRTGNGLAVVRASGDLIQRVRGLRETLLTKTGEPRKSLATRRISDASPDIVDALIEARDKLFLLECRRRALDVLVANKALLRLTQAIAKDYDSRKAAQAALDYDDLIAKTEGLLSRADAAPWVLYKLDGGMDHILVDEAQDTSPRQWQVIAALADEFFAGDGARDETRTVFAVGDEKQSIYSFQGAVPAEFGRQGRLFREKASAAGKAWHPIDLNLSFRSTAPVLDSVDRVFANPAAAEGLTGSAAPIVHFSHRAEDAGHVELWEGEETEKPEPSGSFDPLGDRIRPGEAVTALADRIADTIQEWMRTGERLESQDRPIAPGDVLILVRRRDPFAQVMIKALKSRELPVAGSDRMRLQDQLAVRDLMALGDFLLMPDDDLSLAAVLKSPLFGLDDEDLFRLAHGRAASLWDALKARESDTPLIGNAATRLRHLLGRVDFDAPYELYAGLLEEDGMALRRSMLQRLGPEAGDALDAFLARILAFEEKEPPTLQGFLDDLRRGDEEVKRDLEQGRNEVRIMTVHGAKGLESSIVFLPDTFSTPATAGPGRLLPYENEGHFKGAIWTPPGTSGLPMTAGLKAERDRAAREEYHRLLYVAMTRARDRLYVCGWQGRRKPPDGCWYNLVRDALGDDLKETQDAKGRTIWQLASEQKAVVAKTEAPESRTDAVPLPDWAVHPVESDEQATRALTPSGALSETEISEQAVASPLELANDNRFARGLLIHTLLEHLPALDPAVWEVSARQFVEARGTQMSDAQRDEIVTETLAVLRDSEFSSVFGAGSLAEASLAARLPAADPKMPTIDVAGQIDRIVVTDQEILIVDYKTNRPPPEHVEDASPAYIAQLALYRAAVRRRFPGKRVRAALLWTAIPRLMALPDALLDAQESRLGIAAMHGLDAPGART